MKNATPCSGISMGLKVVQVEAGSPAAKAGLRIGDKLQKINDHPIRDSIDFQYHTSDGQLEIQIQRNDQMEIVCIERDLWTDLGIQTAPMSYCTCGNHCVFCFVDQNPKGLRKTLYFKDEDYRLSFLHGNYVTLTRVGEAELERIVEQQLSPLYLSIHATDPVVRQRLLGIKKDDRMMDKIRYLAEHGIEMHGQIVLCPGWNDGDVLKQTLNDLLPFYPRLSSIAVVPVGLTRHRERLIQMTGVDAAVARQVLAQIFVFQETVQKQFNTRLVFASDEFYLKGGVPLPEPEFYEGYPQIENGVGLVRSFLADLQESVSFFPEAAPESNPAFWIVGTSVAPILESEALPILKKIDNLHVRIKPVINRFFGESVTVTGLLTGQDIIRAMESQAGSYRLLIPAVCLNTDGLFLDDQTPDDVSKALGQPVHIMNDFEDFYA